jgi:hypothetical protein
MAVNSQNVYRDAVSAHHLPESIVGTVSLARLSMAFSQMADDLKSRGAPADQQKVFQGAIAYAAERARHLTPAERTAVQIVLSTAFEGLPRNHSAMAVRGDFLRQVTFPPGRA